MEALLSTLAAAAITAVTVLAYKHPAGYRDIACPLLTIFTVGAAIGLGSWDLAVTKAYIALADFIPHEKIKESQVVVRALGPPNWWIFGCAVAFLYWRLLTYLPLLTRDGDRKQE